MITEQAMADCPASSPIDKRIPPEVWARIFSHLYPSQLSRLSMVNKNFYGIVSSLSKWSQIFSVAHSKGGKRLRILRGMPESKSYMLYLCAMSLYICENCYRMTNFCSLVENKPCQRLAPMRTLANYSQYVGQELNTEWTISTCENCIWRDDYMRQLDKKTRERLSWYRTQP